MQWLAGHAQTSFYSGVALAAYGLWRLVLAPDPPGGRVRPKVLARVTGGFFLAALIGFGLAAVQLLPTAELQGLSQRAAGPDYDFAMTYSLWPLRLIAFFSPRFFGHPATGDYWGYCCNYWEDNGYGGLLPLLLAIGAVIGWVQGGRAARASQVAPDRRPKGYSLIPFFALLAIVGLLLALGIHTPLYPWVFEHIPGFGQFQAPARLLVWWTFGIALLAGVGAEMWRPTLRVKRVARYGVVVGLALLLAAGALPGFSPAGRLLLSPVCSRWALRWSW